MQVGQPSNLNWLGWVIVTAIILVVAYTRHRRARRSFAIAERLQAIAPTSAPRALASFVLTILALVGIVIGLMDIRWGRVWREVPQRGIEVMFVLDVSRSMLAQDVPPNRLERSKQFIKDMMQEMGGDRVGLVVFAGDVKKQIPLTNHYDDYAASLAEVGPQLIERGGSDLANAIEAAAYSFLDKTSDHRAIVLFTDGEYHENEPIEAAQKAYEEQGTRIFTVGIGDASSGARIPAAAKRRGERSQFLEYEGQAVVSKQNEAVLSQIALETNGAYIPAGTKNVDMGAVYHQFVAGIEERDFDTARINAYVPRYPWFLGCSLLLLVIDACFPGRSKRLSPSSSNYVDSSSVAKEQEQVEPSPNVQTQVAGGAVSASSLTEETSGVQTPRSTTVALLLLSLAGTVGPLGWCPLALGQDPTVASSNETTSAAEQAMTQLTAEELVQMGQQALKRGDAAGALEQFQQAQDLGFADPRLSYNMGVASYAQGELAAARQSFAAAATARNNQLASRARYNMGNTHYAEALQQLKQDPNAAMTSLQQAIASYRRALAADPADRDARANIELADRLRRKIKQQQQQQPEQQPSQDQQSQNQNDQQQNDQQQQDQQQDNESQDDPNEDQKGDQNSEGQQDSQDGQPESSEDSPSDPQQSDEPQPSEQQPDSDSQDKPSEQPGSNQESDPGDQQNPESNANDDTPPPEGDLKAINETQESTGGKDTGREGPPMTMQEARKLLQAIRDREFRNRLQQLRRMRPRRVPVDKDW